ncbi:MAG: polysaccharide pyruvyl transferase family protein [Clostridia bacterium]|nr:polysaccharide pyruvyl transferase family protein [Clostridia bacterium]
MARILIWRPIVKGNELDIFNKTEYDSLYEHIRVNFNGVCPNWGNKLWFMGLYSQINDSNNQITFRSSETPEEINDNYDMIIYPMANFFGREWAGGMEALAEVFEKIKIPTYIIACGVQADDYSDLDTLVSDIGDRAKKFISAIYNTGGEFALRGEFSKEFFVKLGFDSAVVTGCPSLYQLGRNFRMNSLEKVEMSELKPLFNGKMSLYSKAALYFSESEYFDQDHYFPMLYDETFLNDRSLRAKLRFYRSFGLESALYLSEGRLKHIADMDDWYAYIKKSRFNYSFGTRIHGSIMPILSGIPATVFAIDTRTQEMAEFYNIPCVRAKGNECLNERDVYKLYLEADYTKFNQTYEEKYLKYESFLRERGIVSKINENNTFLKEENGNDYFDRFIKNREEFKEFYKELKRIRPLLALGDTVMKLKEKL